MSDNPTRQHYDIATGGSGRKAPPKTAGTPGFKKGGSIKKQSGGQVFNKGGKTQK